MTKPAGFAVPSLVVFALTIGFFILQANGNGTYIGGDVPLWVDGTFIQFCLLSAVRTASIIGLMGAGVALFIWKVAYRRKPQPSTTSEQAVFNPE